MPDLSTPTLSDSAVLQATQRWLERAVIGLNLCPFAKAVHVKGQIRYVVSDARDAQALQADFESELAFIAEADAQQVDTTLLIAPHCLQDFLDYNDFLDIADELLELHDLDGVIQVASFHPDYQFAGTTSDDVTNFTNRSPYPMLHLLREESVERAVEAFPQAEDIFERNMQTMRGLGVAGWKALGVDAATKGKA